MKSLLNKSLSQFLVCAVIILFLSAPLFYLLTKYFYAEDLINVIEATRHGNQIPALDLEEDIAIGMTIQLLLIFAVLSCSLFITLRFITRKLWKPFDETLQRTEHFNLAQDDIPQFPKTKIKEFDRLNQSLKKLMKRDKSTYRIQKEFAENASHELQTPIAITRSKLDLLMQEQLNERQMHLVSSLYDLNTRMEHLNRNLLLLAKIENAQYTKMEFIELGDFIQNSLASYDMFLHGLSLTLIDGRVKKSLIRANTVLLSCLLNNLIINAIRHTVASNGEIRINLEEGRISISNESDDGPLDECILFQRFRSGDSKLVGNGLGLAIVKAICDYHDWKIQYSFLNRRHVFTVIFNKAVII